MSKGFRFCTECVSTVFGGKVFDLTESKRISRVKMPEGGVHSLYQDPSGEYFGHLFTPQRDEILRLNQDEARELTSVLNEDGTFSEDALEQAGNVWRRILTKSATEFRTTLRIGSRSWRRSKDWITGTLLSKSSSAPLR